MIWIKFLQGLFVFKIVFLHCSFTLFFFTFFLMKCLLIFVIVILFYKDLQRWINLISPSCSMHLWCWYKLCKNSLNFQNTICNCLMHHTSPPLLHCLKVCWSSQWQDLTYFVDNWRWTKGLGSTLRTLSLWGVMIFSFQLKIKSCKCLLVT